ncbi:MAG: hypothetical protein WCT19_02165 [Candidatus Paceibacterota bacterium]
MSSSPELDKYIAEARQNGMSDDQIRSELLKAGWDLSNINLGTNSVKPPIQTQTPPVYTPTEAKPFQPQDSEPAYNTAPIEQSLAKPSHRGFKILAVLFILILLGGGAGLGYAYLQKIGPFAKIPYTENDLVSGLLSKLSEINTSLYTSSVSFDIVPREAGAEPFVIQVSNEGQLRQQYQNDYDRSRSVSSLLQNLGYIKGKYPSTIQELSKGISTYRSSSSINDPTTGNPYAYKLTDNGRDFALTVNFETDNAIKTIKKSYGFAASTTLINGKGVTFTKGSYKYLYLASEPPKPFLVSLGEYSRMLPPDISAKLAFSATSDLTKSGQSDWKFNLDGSGDFGDLTYAVNVDALSKDGIYYVRVNKIPSLFLSSLASIKGTWIKIDPSASSTSSLYGGYNEFSSISSGIPQAEESYKKNRAEAVDFIKKTASIADQENIFTFKKNPALEMADGRSLYRYDLKIKKEAIVPFYKKLMTEIAKSQNSQISSLSENQQGTLDYLESKEFSDVFDYLDKNTDIVIYVDKNGFPAIIQYTMRIVPPDTALQLKDKQANLTFKLMLSKINEPVSIETPSNSKPLQEVIDENAKNLNYGGASAAATTKANLSSVRVSAELVWNKNSGYGTKAFSVGACSNLSGTLFGDKDVYSSIQLAAGGDASKATCASTASGGKVDKYAVSVPLPGSEGYSWCVDSAGNSKQITGSIKSNSCN